jgi:cytochrome c oxidase subunit I
MREIAVGAEHAPSGFIRKYVFSFDHKVIGIQYIVTAMVMALLAGGLAVMIRIQLAWPDTALVRPESYLAVVTMHGTIMVFFVVSLALVSGFGNFLIPLMIGARDMAYPLLNMLSYWTIVPACGLILLSAFVEGGAAAAGWTAYPPLSALKEAIPGSGWGQTLWLLAMALFIVSFTMSGLNFLTTILNMRAPGMSMYRMPLVIWTFLVATILGLLAFPPLTAAAIMLLLDRHAGTNFYLPEGIIFSGKVLPHQGGTPLLFQHLFWFLGHPEVYVLVLPAMGVAFEVAATFTRRPPFGYRTSIYALFVIAVMSLIVWGHHMFVSGMNPYVGKYFSIATVAITMPFSLVSVNLLASLWRGQIRLATPMLFVLAMISVIGTGGLGGLYLGTATSDVYLHDSYFVVGHFHLMIGMVTFLGTFAGMYYWFPKMFGKMLNDTLGKWHFWFTAVPMFTMFVLMHFQGMGGALRRMYDHNTYEYLENVRPLHLPISLLGFTAVAAQSIFLVNFVWTLLKGKKAPENPWQSAGMEWSTTSPAPHGNWEGDVPTVERWPYEYTPNGKPTDYFSQASFETKPDGEFHDRSRNIASPSAS